MSKHFATPQNKLGFTLIELLVVIAIIGVLAALLMANLVGVRGRAKDTKLKGDLKQLRTALRLYYNDNGSYPATDALPVAGDPFNSGGGDPYMSVVPEYISYTQTDDGDGFLVDVTLENLSDEDAAESASRCGVTPVDYTYYVCQD